MAVARLNIPNPTWVYNLDPEKPVDASNWTPYLTNVWEVERWSRRIQCQDGYLGNDWTTIPFYGATHEWDPHHAEMFYIRLERWSQRICRRLHVPYKKWGFEKPRNAQLEIANWRAISDWAESIEACCGGACPGNLFDVTFTTPPPVPRSGFDHGVGIFHQDTLSGTGGLPKLKKVTILSHLINNAGHTGARIFLELGTPDGVGTTNPVGLFSIGSPLDAPTTETDLGLDENGLRVRLTVFENRELDFRGPNPRFQQGFFGSGIPASPGPTMPTTIWQASAKPTTGVGAPEDIWEYTITLEWEQDCHFWELEDGDHPDITSVMSINEGWELTVNP